MAETGRKIRHGFQLTMILICFVVLLALLGIVLTLGTGGTGTLPALPTDPTAAPTEPPATAADNSFDREDPQNAFQQEAKQEETKKINLWDMISDALSGDRVKETEDITLGIDVAKYQGTIDWQQVSAAGMDFAIVRLGYRTMVSGEITEDTNARFNLQEAEKAGLKLGAYFFSTAISEQEAIEEANWVADFLAPYPITYPVAYNCEGFGDPENRQYSLSKRDRTDIALAFLKQIEKRGYEAMFYASKNEMEDDAKWEVSRIEEDYKVWVAQYPENPYPETKFSSYSRVHHMWQFTRSGEIPGIPAGVDVDIAYFGYEGSEEAQSGETLPEAKADPEALMPFREVDEQVTAKNETNLRDIPSQDTDATVLDTLKNGEIAQRTGISDSGWSRLEFEGKIFYAVSSYLTTDLAKKEEPEPTEDDGIDTEFRSVNEQVTAKEWVNLRKLPSTTMAEAVVVRKLENGQIATRTGVSDNGWSRLKIDGEVLYCVSSYLIAAGSEPEEDTHEPGIQTQFQEVNDNVTAKEAVNLRTLPSTTDPDCKVVTQLKKGDIARRTGINTDVGWSRVEYNGQILYCVSSYLEVVE